MPGSLSALSDIAPRGSNIIHVCRHVHRHVHRHVWPASIQLHLRSSADVVSACALLRDVSAHICMPICYTRVHGLMPPCPNETSRWCQVIPADRSCDDAQIPKQHCTRVHRTEVLECSTDERCHFKNSVLERADGKHR